MYEERESSKTTQPRNAAKKTAPNRLTREMVFVLRWKICMGALNVANPMWKKSSADWQARLGDDSGFAVVQGKLKTDTAYTATPQTCTGYLTIYDSAGTAYKVMVST